MACFGVGVGTSPRDERHFMNLLHLFYSPPKLHFINEGNGGEWITAWPWRAVLDSNLTTPYFSNDFFLSSSLIGTFASLQKTGSENALMQGYGNRAKAV